MSNHTPGPWTRHEWDENDGYDCIYGGIRITTGADEELLIVVGGENYNEHDGAQSDEDRERMEADARLIAAAPELLECALLARHVCEDGNALQQMLDAAIAKATGATP